MSHIDPTAARAPLRPDWSSRLIEDGQVDFTVDRRRLVGLAASVVFAFLLGAGCEWFAWTEPVWFLVPVGAYLLVVTPLVLAPRIRQLATLEGPLLRVTADGLRLAVPSPIDVSWTDVDGIVSVVRGGGPFGKAARAHTAVYVDPEVLARWRAGQQWWQQVAEIIEHCRRPACLYLPKALTASAIEVGDWLEQEWAVRGPLASPEPPADEAGRQRQ